MYTYLNRRRRLKSTLSLQFLIGISFFLLAIIFAIIILLVYSVRYFSYLYEKETYSDFILIEDNFYNAMLFPNNTINYSFISLIDNCSSNPYYSPTMGINKDYISIGNILLSKKLNSFSISEKRYIVLYTPQEYNFTTMQGVFNNSIIVRLLRRNLNSPYSVLYFNGKYYKQDDVVIYKGKRYNVEYIDKKGYFAFLKENTTLSCGPIPPKYKSIYVSSLFVHDKRDNITREYLIYIW